MKPTLDIQLIGLPKEFRANIISKVNEFIIDRQDIWEQMWEVRVEKNDEGKMVLFIRVPFYEITKRDAFREKIEAEIKLATWAECDIESYIALHECDHDDGSRRGCKVRKILEK